MKVDINDPYAVADHDTVMRRDKREIRRKPTKSRGYVCNLLCE